MSSLEELKKEILAEVAAAADLAALEAARVSALGKKGRLTEEMKKLGALPPDQRKDFGAEVNLAKEAVAAALDEKQKILSAAALTERLEKERVDVTLSSRPRGEGRIHPLSQVWDEVVEIFANLGFKVARGPDIESDWYNFAALNMPPNHPARQMQDTFYMGKTGEGEPPVLRTHTSPVQIRAMQAQKPPIRVVALGRTFRVDSDATHSPMFHQYEGLVIDETTHIGHLKWMLEEFYKAFFELKQVELRARPSFFPFTEPSIEWDMRCDRSGGKLKLGEGNDWLELAGSGMVHPQVLRNVGLDPEKVQGFAFGGGLDRLAMLKYGIPDIRSFFESDLRWLRHYGFAALDIPKLATRA